ncbi:rod shape-determining protein MreC [Candidatus Daviesbacteria bacterium]|nr:rod shape-determining protein MreC [Candidatus Daviesbacteria bacterium]
MLSNLLYDARILLSLVFVSILIIIVDSLGFFNYPKSLLQQVTIPIQYGLYKTYLSVSRQFEFIILARRASQENKALTEQLAQVLSENAQLRKKLAETESFLQQQKTLDPQTFNLIATRPIGINRYMLLDKGSEDGIILNQTVIYKDNYLGEIKEVSPKKSKVQLPSDPDSKVAVFVADANGKAKGILVGLFGSDMLIDKVLHQEPLSKNDLVYTEGTEGKMPRGLIVGQISEVLQKENEVFKQAKVRPVFDITNLDIVFVITN